jgi:hypothetical protein
VTDLTITNVGDAWVNSAATKTGVNYGSTATVHVKSGERQGFILPPLQPIAGRTVLSATLVGRVTSGHVAQTYTVAPVTERWSPGRITWANRPNVNGAAQVTEAVSALPDGGLVEVDVTSILSSVAAGTEWFGLRITTDSTTIGQAFYATDSGSPAWELLVELSDAPEQPSNLRPDGGAVATGEPVLAWDFIDLGGESTEQAESQVQIDSPAVGVDPDEVAPDYDSGWVANLDPEYDLAAVTYTPPATPAQSTFWRVRVKDAAGVVSEWSDWADFTVSALPTLVVDSPTGSFGDPSPTLTAHLTGGTLASWKAWATGPNRADVRDESGAQTGAIDWTVAARNKDGRRVFTEDEAGWIYLRAYDTVDRAVAVGQSPYVETWIPIDLTEGGAATAPTGLSVTPTTTGGPILTWSWSRTEAADAWLIQVDGVTIERLEPDDVSVNAGVYTWTDSGQVQPMRPHQLRVRGVEGDETTAPATIATYAHNVVGVWLIPEGGEPIYLAGGEVGDFAAADNSATYRTLDGKEIDIIYGPGLLTGTFSGGVSTESRSADEVWTTLDRIDALAAASARRVRMVWGSRSILVDLRSPHHAPHDTMRPHNLRHRGAFGFVQVGD